MPTDASPPDDDVRGAASIERGRFTLLRQPWSTRAAFLLGNSSAHGATSALFATATLPAGLNVTVIATPQEAYINETLALGGARAIRSLSGSTIICFRPNGGDASGAFRAIFTWYKNPRW